MAFNFFNNLIIKYALVVNIISSYKFNCFILKELKSSDFIVKIKINGTGYQNIINPDIKNIDNQKYPDEIIIEKENGTVSAVGGGICHINLEDDDNLIIMKWNTYPNSTNNMFANCVSITEIDLSQFDLTLITIMKWMFLNCYNLTKVTFGNYNTSNLKNTNSMFNTCYRLTSINLYMLDTSNVVDMEFMFFRCYSLKSLNLSNFKTGKVKSFFKMFRLCQNLETLDLSNFDTSLATNISYMFSDCKRLLNLIMSSFDTSNIVDMSYLFSGCCSLTSCFKI